MSLVWFQIRASARGLWRRTRAVTRFSMSCWKSGRLASADLPSHFWLETHFYFIVYVSMRIPKNRCCKSCGRLWQLIPVNSSILSFILASTPTRRLKCPAASGGQAACLKLLLSLTCPQEGTSEKHQPTPHTSGFKGARRLTMLGRS